LLTPDAGPGVFITFCIFIDSDIGNDNTARTCENGNFDKNMNIADSNVDQYKHDISIQNIVERRTPSKVIRSLLYFARLKDPWDQDHTYKEIHKHFH
jgi:hypothetical protein